MMSYAIITALIFVLVALVHGYRIYEEWPVQIGPPLHFHDCIVGRPGRFCAVSDLGL
jgi:hypothetical protein